MSAAAAPSVYFDHNATTPVDPRVRDAMLPWLGERYGNASSVHAFGQAAREAVEAARAHVAALLGVPPPEIVFGSSGTELNNAVIFSCASRASPSEPAAGHFVISAFEHPSVLRAADRLEALGCTVSRVRPDEHGVVDVDRVVAEFEPDTRLVCLMYANNEVGTLQPIAELSAVCRGRGIPLLCDVVQAVGKIEVDCRALGAPFVTLGGHKFHGPPGVAALRIEGGTPFAPHLLGGSHERGRRASTSNVPGIVGLGVAAELAAAEQAERGEKMARLRDRFERGVVSIPDVRLHSTSVARLPNTSHVAFDGVDAEALLIRLDLAGFAVSTGSACSSGSVEPSTSLAAMGMAREEAISSLRVSFGVTNEEDEVDRFLDVLIREVRALRGRVATEGR